MAAPRRDDAYTPAQVSAATGLPVPAVHKAMEHGVIRPKRVRRGHSVQRLLSKAQVLYLWMEAKGLCSLPLAARHRVAQAVERNPSVDVLTVSEGSVLLIECKMARQEVETALRRLAEARRMVISDPEIMRGTPVYRGTRIPVHLVADMLDQGASGDEILEGYPGLTPEKVALAPMYAKAFPSRGRPVRRPWAKYPPRRVTKHGAASR